MTTDRLARLQELMDARGIDAVALVPGANLLYLTGLSMHTSERITLALFTRGGQGYLLLPALEVARAETYLRTPMKLYPWSDAEGTRAGWSALARDLDLAGKMIAVEYLNLRVLEQTELQVFAPGFKQADASQLLAELRMVKDAEELAAMRRAARVIGASLDEIFKLVRPGITEKELASAWQMSMRRCGADTIPEEPIVASGPNSAAPHITSSDRPLVTGDLVIFDGWCQVDGYFTDITRTIAVGSLSPDLKRIYDTVLAANQAGRDQVAPGVQAQAVDRAARAVIDRAGYGQYFVHRTGHGLGLEVHEAPGIVEGNTLALAPGVTFTVEPGIYMPGQGGVRIEDDVVVTQETVETLTQYPRELRVL
ncbi:MAG: Xaa-Pro peptidase family protein [Anaerolineae bacterium]